MKTLTKILFLLFVVLSSCSIDDTVDYNCTQGTIRILNKEKWPCTRGGGDCSFKFYLYDGKKAYWCDTDKNTWRNYNINDTLPTLVITKTIHNDK
jgi:hypothetical protein